MTKDVNPWMLVMGVPAKEVRQIEENQVVEELVGRFKKETSK